jgi:hypothetical protein
MTSGNLALVQSNTACYSKITLINTGTSGKSIDIGVGGNTSAQANKLYVYDNGASALRFSIDSTGIATFACSVIAVTESEFRGTTVNTRLLITATGVANTVIGFNNSGATTTGVINNASYVGVLQAYPLIFTTDGTERLRIASTGASTFACGVTATRMVVGGSATSRILQVNTSGNDGIRILTSGDNPTLDMMQTAAANAAARNWRIVTNWEGWGTLDFQSGTNNTNDPATTRLSINGTNGVITFNNYTAGTLSTSSSGVISASDGRFKTKTRNIDNGLDIILKLKPTYYFWNEDSPFASEYEELGFIAQEVAIVIPEASPEPETDKFKNYHDRAIIAMLTKAIQEQQVQIEELKAKIK